MLMKQKTTTRPTMENLKNTELKYTRYTNHLWYSLRCLHNNLIPNDLCLKPKDKNHSKIQRKCFIVFSEFVILCEHIKTTHTHTPCLMMGVVSLEMLPKNIMIQDMINSETVWIQLNQQTQKYSRLSKGIMEHPHFPNAENLKKRNSNMQDTPIIYDILSDSFTTT